MNHITAVAHSGDGVLPNLGVADVTEHLIAEFDAAIDPGTITGVVLGGIHDLQCSPAAARVVGVERLARDRLRALISEGGSRAR